jgi:hypothetical protein
MRDTIDIDSDLMERLAFESGREIEIGLTHALLHMPRRTYRAPLAIPTQRTAGESS